jgi:hypothetical protein
MMHELNELIKLRDGYVKGFNIDLDLITEQRHKIVINSFYCKQLWNNYGVVNEL